MYEQPVTQQELARLHAAWELSPESRSFAPLADAYHRAGRHEEAIELLHSGTARHPDYLSALVLLADCYQALQRTEEANALYVRVLSQDEENIRALEHQAVQSIQQGALGKAAALVEKLRQIDPWDANIRRLSAQLQQSPVAPQPPPADTPSAPLAPKPLRFALEQPEAASVQPDPQPSAADVVGAGQSSDELSTLTLAQIYESQGYLQKALTIYQRLLQQHPGNTQVLQRLEELRRRLTGVDESGYASAEPAQPALPVQPEQPRPADTAASDAEPGTTAAGGWRLVDKNALGALRPASSATPWSAKEDAPPGNSDAAADAAASRDEDFQRFLRYVRSLGR